MTLLHLLRVVFTGYSRPATPAETELRQQIDALTIDVQTASSERAAVAATLAVRTVERDLLAGVLEYNRRRVAAEELAMPRAARQAATNRP